MESTKVGKTIGATTGKRPILIKRYGLVYRAAMCTGITARPDLTGIYKHNTLKDIFCIYCLVLHRCKYRHYYNRIGSVHTSYYNLLK